VRLTGYGYELGPQTVDEYTTIEAARFAV